MKQIKLPKKFPRKQKDQSQKGAAMIEYGLIVALIALIAFAGITLIGQNAPTFFSSMASSF